MLVLGTWLGAVGACDLLRASRDTTSWGRRLLVVGIGLALLTFGLLVAGDVAGWVAVACAASLVAWVLGSAVALSGAGVVARTVAYLGLGAGLAVGLVADDTTSVDWPSRLGGVPLAHWPVEQVVLVAAVVLAQLATANVAVRLLLDSVGVPAVDGEKQLRGGRVLGPLERLFVVGLAAGGAVTAAAVVVAAKGLLRFPELQRRERAGPSDVTEYFLIGSFASWLVALGGVALLRLGQALS